jgi:hypothetical protein
MWDRRDSTSKVFYRPRGLRCPACLLRFEPRTLWVHSRWFRDVRCMSGYGVISEIKLGGCRPIRRNQNRPHRSAQFREVSNIDHYVGYRACKTYLHRRPTHGFSR